MLPLKAVMAVLLVADHLTFHVDAGWLRPFREIGAPIVSIFFFISGFGLMRSYSTRGASYLDGFFRKRIWKVLLPALVALALFYIFDWNWSRDFIGEFRDLFTKGQPILPYSWFVVAIILFYVSFWLIFRYLPEKLHLAGLVSAGIILGGGSNCIGIRQMLVGVQSRFSRRSILREVRTGDIAEMAFGWHKGVDCHRCNGGRIPGILSAGQPIPVPCLLCVHSPGGCNDGQRPSPRKNRLETGRIHRRDRIRDIPVPGHSDGVPSFGHRLPCIGSGLYHRSLHSYHSPRLERKSDLHAADGEGKTIRRDVIVH